MHTGTILTSENVCVRTCVYVVFVCVCVCLCVCVCVRVSYAITHSGADAKLSYLAQQSAVLASTSQVIVVCLNTPLQSKDVYVQIIIYRHVDVHTHTCTRTLTRIRTLTYT